MSCMCGDSACWSCGVAQGTVSTPNLQIPGEYGWICDWKTGARVREATPEEHERFWSIIIAAPAENIGPACTYRLTIDGKRVCFEP